jgi:hypothetical protein
MNRQNTVFITTIFPSVSGFLSTFFESIKKQTYKEFDLLIMNDGYIGDIEQYGLENFSADVINICNKTPAEIRAEGINYALEKNYKIIVLGDADDYFSENRIQKSVELLKNYDIVVNDLTIVDAGENNVIEGYLSSRINNKTEIPIEFIYERNIFGLSNTAFRTNFLKKDFRLINDKVIAFDWLLFSGLLLEGGKAIFTDECISYYRVYDGNTIGLSNPDEKKIILGLQVKKQHYNLLKNKNQEYKKYYEGVVEIIKQIEVSEEFKRNFITHYLQKHNLTNLFWWE